MDEPTPEQLLDEIVQVLLDKRMLATLRVEHLMLLLDIIDDQVELVDTVVRGCQNIVRDVLIKLGMIRIALTKEDSKRAAIYGMTQYMDRDGTLLFRLTPKRAAPLLGDPAYTEESNNGC